jgi:uncharacterized OB-fold protein
MKQKVQEELIYIDMTMKIPYKWRTGEFNGEFFRELKENGIMYANQCPTCGRSFCLPRSVCTRDHTKCTTREKWIPVGPKGTLVTFFMAEQSFLLPTTGEMLKIPFAVGVVLLDGGMVTLQHQLEETDTDKIKPFMRVEAVIKPKAERKGNIYDIIHFKTINE